MLNPFDHTGDEGTVFQDMVMLALAGFVMLVLLMLPHLNPPTKKQEGDIKSPGAVTVEIRWADNSPSDVDLWVQAPGDGPVGYSSKNGVVFNLLRDDLGTDTDLSNLNYEFAFSRGAPAGEYTVNVHGYRLFGTSEDVDVKVAVKDSVGTVREIWSGRVTVRLGEEVTAVRFTLNDNYGLARPLNFVPRAVRNQREAQP